MSTKVDKSELLRQRFSNLTTLSLNCTIITPMFLGNADQKAELRAEPFKGLLRYWWRVAAGRNFASPMDMLEKESKIFGGGGDKGYKSLVRVKVEGTPKVVEDEKLPAVKDIKHPEVPLPVNPLLYLGYGPITWKKGKGAVFDRSYLAPGENFKVIITLPDYLLKDKVFSASLFYVRAFGTIGSRCRNGWGSFQITKIDPETKGIALYKEYNEELYERDYPFVLAGERSASGKKDLIWKTSRFHSTWQDTMKELAEIYIAVRVQLGADGRGDIDERHLLGFPLTNHFAVNAPNWGGKARHASPLRLLVRKRRNGYVGFVLHLPFGISSRMRRNASGSVFFNPTKQFSIWQKVHDKLDKLMQRARINECL